MPLNLVTPPTDWPVTLDQAKAQLRLETTADDALIEAYLEAATAHLDGRAGILGRQIMTATWALRLDRFPCDGGPIEIPLPPLQSVSSIAYIDSAGASQTWSSALYQVDAKSEPGRVLPVYGESYPSTRAQYLNAVTITFVAGYGAAEDVPASLRQALLLLASHMYEERTPIGSNRIAELPYAATALLAPHRMFAF